jgi:glycosyltransferase involved in cell wall biosynthesis
MKVIVVTPDLEDNSLGRTYCLWLLAESLGWDTVVVSRNGSSIWKPLATTDFATVCRRLDSGHGTEEEQLARIAEGADLVIAVKPLPDSLGLTLRALAHNMTPVIVDIDDPDIEVRSTWLRPHQQLKRWLTQPRRQFTMWQLRHRSMQLPSFTSNPILQAIYGGLLVPHVRPAEKVPQFNSHGDRITVAFVGSPKTHKGVDDIRAAVAATAHLGYDLVVTGDPPSDAADWERWVGQVSFTEGMALVKEADIVAIPSHISTWSRAQLPAKLIDAMMFGRAVIVSDVGPMSWAVGDSGIVIPPGDPSALESALLDLRSGLERERLGKLAHARASREFSVESVAPSFSAFCLKTISTQRTR